MQKAIRRITIEDKRRLKTTGKLTEPVSKDKDQISSSTKLNDRMAKSIPNLQTSLPNSEKPTSNNLRSQTAIHHQQSNSLMIPICKNGKSIADDTKPVYQKPNSIKDILEHAKHILEVELRTMRSVANLVQDVNIVRGEKEDSEVSPNF